MSHHEALSEVEWAAPTDVPRAAGAAATWAWATKDGAAEWVSIEQLLLWLGRGQLPPDILVWKPGWAEWSPASQVAELAAVLPRRATGSPAPAPKASAPPTPRAAPSSPTLSPHAIELALPAPGPAAPASEQPSQPRGGGGSLGTLIVGAIAVLSLGSSWAAFSLAMIGLQPVDPSSSQSSSSAQPAASGTVLQAPSAAAEPAGAVSTGAPRTADRVPLAGEPKPAVLRVGDLAILRPRALPPAPRAPARRRVSSRH